MVVLGLVGDWLPKLEPDEKPDEVGLDDDEEDGELNCPAGVAPGMVPVPVVCGPL